MSNYIKISSTKGLLKTILEKDKLFPQLPIDAEELEERVEQQGIEIEEVADKVERASKRTEEIKEIEDFLTIDKETSVIKYATINNEGQTYYFLNGKWFALDM